MFKSRFFAVCCAITVTICAIYVITSNVPEPSSTIIYPINYELKHSKSKIDISHRVSFNQEKNVYTYYFRIENQSEETYIVSWDVLNQLKGFTTLIILNPKDAHQIYHESKFPPKFQSGQFLTFKNMITSWEPIKELSATQAGPVPNENP